MAQTEFDVFLSYNSKDRPAVVRLAERLREQGLKVWLDVWELRPGHPWQEALEDTIESIQAAAVLVGRDGIGPWQNVEMRGCLSEFVQRGQPVIPVLLDECMAIPKLPFFLKQFTWVDLRDGQQEEGLQRLVWGITGKKPPFLTAPSEFRPNTQAESVAAKSTSPGRGNAGAVAEEIGQPASDAFVLSKERDGQRTVSPLLPPVNIRLGPAKPTPAEPQPFSILRHRLRDGSPGPEMVLIPAGEFRMGDLDGFGRHSEKPVHLVRIARPFYIGRYAVTFDEYDRFAQAQGIKLPGDQGWGRGNRPVINVSWENAVAYCHWLSEQTGQAYRLPSEAEWEYAARAGTETAYWWGNETGQNRANFDGSGSQWSGKQTAPVGSFPPNPWGLHDTSGNVSEWVRDCWHPDYQGAPDDGSAWEDGGGAFRMLRGGSWNSSGRAVRSASHNGFGPGRWNGRIGFRLALDKTGPGLGRQAKRSGRSG